jgi:hypothetical protein
MPPAMIGLIISLVEELVKIAPSVVTDIQAIFNKPNPTPADWQAIRDSVMAKKYTDFVPDSQLPPGT